MTGMNFYDVYAVKNIENAIDSAKKMIDHSTIDFLAGLVIKELAANRAEKWLDFQIQVNLVIPIIP